MTADTAPRLSLPAGAELTALYSRGEVRARLGWGDDKLRRRLSVCRHVVPSGSGRGQQFTGADIVALYLGGTGCQQAGSKSTHRGRSGAARAGTSEARTPMAGRSKEGSRQPSRLRELLNDLDNEPSRGPTVVPLRA